METKVRQEIDGFTYVRVDKEHLLLSERRDMSAANSSMSRIGWT